MIALAALVLYVVAARPYIVDGDNAEFAALGAVGGVGHPPGYPLYVLILRALSWLPASTPASAAALATVLITMAQLLVLHAACRAWGARPLAASIAVAIYAACPVALRVQSEAEVFALNGLVVALVLWLAASGGPATGLRRAALLGLVAGLGLANHTTCALVAPIGIYSVVRGARESQRTALAVLVAIGGLVVGLLPYVYLFLAPATRASWTTIDDLRALVHHMLRYDFGGPGAFARNGGEPDTGGQLLALATMLARSWLWLPLALGLGALGLGIARPRGETRWAWAMLALSFVVAGPLLVARFNLPPSGLTLHMCQRFYLLPLVLLVVPVAAGFDRLGALVAEQTPSMLRSLRTATALVTVGFAAIGVASLPHIAAAHSPAVEQGVRNMLHSLPPKAVVLVAADDVFYGSAYLQDALDERTDVDVVAWTMMGLDAYRDRVTTRLHATLDRQHVSSAELAEQLLAQGRPVFVDGLMSGAVRALPTYPHGVLFRVLPHGTPLPPIGEVFALNKQLFAKFEFGYPVPTADPELYSTYIHSEYARTWAILAKALAATGNRDDYTYALDMARAIGPQSP